MTIDETIQRAVGSILAEHGQKVARRILREAVIRIGLDEGLPAGIQAARTIADDLESDNPRLF